MFSNCQEQPVSPPHRRGCPGNRPTTSSGIRPFCIHVTRMHSSRVVLAVTGAVDWATAGALRATALEEIAAGARKLVLDFSYLSFWDSSGMGAVASAYRSRRRLGRPCRTLAGIGENVSTDRDGQSGPAPPRRVHGPHGIGQFAPHRPATRHGIRSRSSPCTPGTWVPRIGSGRPPRQHALRADSPPWPSHGTGPGPAGQAPPLRRHGGRPGAGRGALAGRHDRSAASAARGIGAPDCPMRSRSISGSGVTIRCAPRLRGRAALCHRLRPRTAVPPSGVETGRRGRRDARPRSSGCLPGGSA